MMKKGACTGRVGKLEKVFVEKIGDRVTVTGAYTKAELRELLRSSASLDSTLKKADTKHEDKEKISKDDQRMLKAAKISRGIISKATLIDKWRRREKRSRVEEKKLGEKVTSPTPRKEFGQLLRAKGLSESLIKELRANGLTDEYMRLLRALGITDEEIEELIKSLQTERDMLAPSGSTDPCASELSFSDQYLSPESLYLKTYFRSVLSNALREILMKKPFDPIEYLGHWLLNYKICEERNAKRRQMELELRIEREMLKMKDMEDMEDIDDIDVPDERGEEEGYAEEWN